ncbi:MAG: ChrR family anti-sigma-E factor [Caulobacteraceae bacterium]
MNVRHHPSQDLLIDYASGALRADRALVISTHLRACEACRGEVSLAEAVAGSLLASLPPARMEPDALERALARIETPAPEPLPPAPRPPGWIEIPHDVVEAVRKRRRWAAPGVWVAPVVGGPRGPRSYLLRVGAGMSVPHHTHVGREMVCVLKGAFTDRGETYGPGDFVESDEDVDHRPQVTGEGECVCLVAVDASLVARDWVGRLFQPLVRI